MSKNDNLRVSILDIIRCCGKAKENNEDPLVIERLTNLFATMEKSEVELSKNSPEGRMFLKYYPIAVTQCCITLESLSLAFCRLYFGKNNKELLKRMEKYYRQFYDNLKHGEDNTSLKQEIILDEEAFQLIHQFSDYETYGASIVSKSIDKQLEKTKSMPELKGKAIVD